MRALLPRSLLCVLLFLIACSPDGQATAAKAAPAGPPRIDYASIPWVPLHPESLRGTPENRIFHQHPTARRPVLLTGKTPLFAKHKLGPGIWIVEVVLAKDGRLARFRILKGPTTDEKTVRLLAGALKEWRFQPAMVDGKPIAVFYTLTMRAHP